MARGKVPQAPPYVREESFDAQLRTDVTRARVTLAEVQGLLLAMDAFLQGTPYSGSTFEQVQHWIWTADRLFSPGEELDGGHPSEFQKQAANLDADVCVVIESVRTAARIRKPDPPKVGKDINPKPAPARAALLPRQPVERRGPKSRKVPV